MKYKVIDYVTTLEACKILQLSKNSTGSITRKLQNGEIKGAYKFGKTWAIPIYWIKSECVSRNIYWIEKELKNDEKGVSLKNYIPIKEYCEKNKISYNVFNSQIARGYYDGEFIRFANTYGLPK